MLDEAAYHQTEGYRLGYLILYIWYQRVTVRINVVTTRQRCPGILVETALWPKNVHVAPSP